MKSATLNFSSCPNARKSESWIRELSAGLFISLTGTARASTFCGNFTVTGMLAGCAISGARIQDLDFPACRQLEKLGVTLIVSLIQN